jgi:hypothetical protein
MPFIVTETDDGTPEKRPTKWAIIEKYQYDMRIFNSILEKFKSDNSTEFEKRKDERFVGIIEMKNKDAVSSWSIQLLNSFPDELNHRFADLLSGAGFLIYTDTGLMNA